jgi:hypothetical protein
MIITFIKGVSDSNLIKRIEKNHNLVFNKLSKGHVKIIQYTINSEKNRLYKNNHKIEILYISLIRKFLIIKNYLSWC